MKHLSFFMAGIVLGMWIAAAESAAHEDDLPRTGTTSTGTMSNYLYVDFSEPKPGITLVFNYEGGPMEIRTTHKPERLIGMIDTAGNLMLTGRVYVDWDGQHPTRETP